MRFRRLLVKLAAYLLRPEFSTHEVMLRKELYYRCQLLFAPLELYRFPFE